ncbi:OmpA family protein [Microbulbifer yueqingensis]|uniref:Outer membrane protein OmpA n=1 Tax=Microbulbifer yueqingensis TaxID=658219 RepID=A0A1G9EV23_9GAMM|nr:OmpA family protein [Microbulbifer yueqingensis]SDK79931.1 Outer membrane protein OmpA [Microbulbifer yueqingensis]
MKKAMMAVTLASLIATGAQGQPQAPEGSKLTPAKQATVFTGAAVAGAAVGGPVGFIAGALGGAWLGEQIRQAEEADMLATQLSASRAELGDLAQQLDAARTSANDASTLALDSLQFQLLFSTGEDRLQESQLAQVAALADFLRRHPDLQVQLEGRADPRGTDGYNNVLSDQRALSVQRALQEQGIDPARISRRAMGSTYSQATRGDTDAYAMERRVDIYFQLPDAVAGHF